MKRQGSSTCTPNNTHEPFTVTPASHGVGGKESGRTNSGSLSVWFYNQTTCLGMEKMGFLHYKWPPPVKVNKVNVKVNDASNNNIKDILVAL